MGGAKAPVEAARGGEFGYARGPLKVRADCQPEWAEREREGSVYFHCRVVEAPVDAIGRHLLAQFRASLARGRKPTQPIGSATASQAHTPTAPTDRTARATAFYPRTLSRSKRRRPPRPLCANYLDARDGK